MTRPVHGLVHSNNGQINEVLPGESKLRDAVVLCREAGLLLDGDSTGGDQKQLT